MREVLLSDKVQTSITSRLNSWPMLASLRDKRGCSARTLFLVVCTNLCGFRGREAEPCARHSAFRAHRTAGRSCRPVHSGRDRRGDVGRGGRTQFTLHRNGDRLLSALGCAKACSTKKLLFVSRSATGVWGLFACIVATFAASLGSLIEVVNRFGSMPHGSMPACFILAMLPRIRANAGPFGLMAGMSAVRFGDRVGSRRFRFSTNSVVGAVTVVVVGALLSAPFKRSPEAPRAYQ